MRAVIETTGLPAQGGAVAAAKVGAAEIEAAAEPPPAPLGHNTVTQPGCIALSKKGGPLDCTLSPRELEVSGCGDHGEASLMGNKIDSVQPIRDKAASGNVVG